ncbi:MAG: hypothetical protein N2593_02970 [Patescibacteria group bacterium]|nr:hypothetical protein [Patescibacteria group bacterium]
MKYQINIIAENQQIVVYRIINLFLKKKIFIEKIEANFNEKENFSKILIIIKNLNQNMIETTIKQINKIIEIKKINYKKIL